MPQSLRSVKSRIRSVEGIRKLTGAMEMVASAKLRPLQKQFFTQQKYFLRIEKLLGNLLASFEDARHKLLSCATRKEKIILCVVTSDTGLCGSYNSEIIHAAHRFIRENVELDVKLVTVGRKGFTYFKKSGYPVIATYTDLYTRYSKEVSDKIANGLIDKFLAGEADEVYVAYANFKTVTRQGPVIEKLLNVEIAEGSKTEYLTEPEISAILEEFIPLYVLNKIRTLILSAFTAEQSRRAIAMHEATKNAKDLADDLTLLKNKMRQAGITGEIIEVISSADALS